MREGDARIPLIVPPPQTINDKENTLSPKPVIDEVVELRDIMPTILDIAHVEIPTTVTGKSLLPLTTTGDPDWRPYLHGEHCWCYSHEQEMQYVTNGHRKCIWLPRVDLMQFFNLDDDPGEIHNLIDDSEFRDEISQWKGHFVHELAQRNCGWVQEGELVCPSDEPLVSPYRNVRFTG